MPDEERVRVQLGDWIVYYDQGDEGLFAGKVAEMDETYFYGEGWNCRRDICQKLNFINGQKRSEDIERLEQWVSDLQSGMYVNCVYCGHRYGPKESTPMSMADILKEHVEKCPEHPMSKLKKRVEELEDEVARYCNNWRAARREIRELEGRTDE